MWSFLNLVGSLVVISAAPAANPDEICYLPIDVMFLQDTTGSFVDDLPNVVSQIPAMVAAILEQNPESYFGVAEFKDKPYFPLGNGGDFCYKLDGPLGGSVSQFQDDYRLLYASGGGDLPEAQFQALIDIAFDPSVGWRPIVRGSRVNTDTGAHVVIMSTDAVMHLPGDMLKYANYPGGDVPQNLPANPGTINPPTLDAACRAYDYPSGDQMKAAVKAQDIYLAILTPEDPDIVPAWNWVNEELLQQPAAFYQFIKSDSSDLITGVLAAIKAVTEYACALTTTMAPSTTTTMTSTSTTTPATTVTSTTTHTTTMTTTSTTTPTTTMTSTTMTTTSTTTPTTTMTSTTTMTTTSTTTPTTTMTATTTMISTPTTTLDTTPETIEEPGTTQHCENPCPPTGDCCHHCHHPCHHEPCCWPALRIDVGVQPKKLSVDYTS